MRRQAGVDGADIDTREGTCIVAYEKAKVLDFKKVEAATQDANYVLVRIGMRAQGEVVSGHCDTCNEDRFYLELRGTKQKLELSKPAPLGKASLEGAILDWKGDHPRLEVE